MRPTPRPQIELDGKQDPRRHLRRWTNRSCSIPSRGAFAIASMYDLSHSRPAWSADASPATPIIFDLHRIARSAAKPATSSRSRCAGDTIANCIVTETKRPGGISSESIPPARRERFGSKPIRSGRNKLFSAGISLKTHCHHDRLLGVANAERSLGCARNPCWRI